MSRRSVSDHGNESSLSKERDAGLFGSSRDVDRALGGVGWSVFGLGWAGFGVRGDCGGIRFALSRRCPLGASGIMSAVASGPGGAERIYRETPERLVYLSGAAGGSGGRVVVKVNRLPRFRNRLKSWRFAPAELRSHLRVQATGLPVPRVYGIFERRPFLLAGMNGLLIEHLDGYRPLTDGDAGPAADMLAQMFRRRVHHPDFMKLNVLWNETAGKAMLIDLEGCRVDPPSRSGALFMQIARFIEYSGLGLGHPASQAFVRQAYARLAPLPVEQDAFLDIVAVMLKRHRTTRERIGIVVPAELREAVRRCDAAIQDTEG